MLLDLPSKKVLTLEAARAISEAALAAADAKGLDKLVVVVVDDGGYPLVLMRQTNGEPAAVDMGLAKARTSAIFRRATKEWKERLLSGATWVLGMANMNPIEGGQPIIVDGQVIGAIGIAGASGVLDTEIATAALASVGL